MAAVVFDDAVLSGGGDRPGCITSHVVGGSLESYRYYVSRRTIMEVLHDRGYIVPDSDLTRSLTEFGTVFGQNLDLERLRICLSLRFNPKNKIMVILCGTDEIRKATVGGIYANLLNKESISGLILVLQSKINSYARKELETYPYKVEIFQISELLVNITKHILQPKHEILMAEEEESSAKEVQVGRKEGYYGLEKGQVVKITYRGGVVEVKNGWSFGGEAFLSASVQILCDQIASLELSDLYQGKKLNESVLQKLKMTLPTLDAVLIDAEEKYIVNSAVQKWLDDLKHAVFDAEDLLDEALRCKAEADYQNKRTKVLYFLSTALHPFCKTERCP